MTCRHDQNEVIQHLDHLFKKTKEDFKVDWLT